MRFHCGLYFTQIMVVIYGTAQYYRGHAASRFQRELMRPRYRNLLVAVFLAGVALVVWRLQASEATTTVLLVTSAERQEGDSASLSEAGRARAEALSRLAGGLAAPDLLAGIFSAGGEPERETVRALSEALDQPITDMLIEDPGLFSRAGWPGSTEERS